MHSDALVIPEPCHADWDAMTGDERRRFCARCNKHVHDLSALTATQAQALVDEEPDLCVQYSTTPDGEIVHRLLEVPVARRGLLAGAASALLVAATPALAGGRPAVPMDAPAEEVDLFERLRAWWAGEQPTPMATEPAPRGPVPTDVPPSTIPELEVPAPPPLPKPEPTVIRGKIARPPVRKTMGKPVRRDP